MHAEMMLIYFCTQRDTEDLVKEGFVFNISTLVQVEQPMGNVSNSKYSIAALVMYNIVGRQNLSL